MKYFITYQQFGGGAQVINNKVIDIHPWDWVNDKNEEIQQKNNSGMHGSIGKVVVLFFSEMKE